METTVKAFVPRNGVELVAKGETGVLSFAKVKLGNTADQFKSRGKAISGEKFGADIAAINAGLVECGGVELTSVQVESLKAYLAETKKMPVDGEAVIPAAANGATVSKKAAFVLMPDDAAGEALITMCLQVKQSASGATKAIETKTAQVEKLQAEIVALTESSSDMQEAAKLADVVEKMYAAYSVLPGDSPLAETLRGAYSSAKAAYNAFVAERIEIAPETDLQNETESGTDADNETESGTDLQAESETESGTDLQAESDALPSLVGNDAPKAE